MAFIARCLKLCSFQGTLVNAVRNVSTHNSTLISASRTLPLLHLTNNPWIWQENNKVQLPVINNTIINLPGNLLWNPPINETNERKIIEEPSTVNYVKEAARLIIIRRKKMKKHKLRKLRKRMKFEWAKIRQRRELKKEKEFQAGLILKCKEAEGFSAEQYVMERIRLVNEVPLTKQELYKKMFKEKMAEKRGYSYD